MPTLAVDLGDDAAIARLLAEDAKAASSRYASQGLSALLPRQHTGSAPKPNTRFLKALVRDADSHNAALRRKEDRERVERLRNGGQRPTDRPKARFQRDENREKDENGRDRKRRRLSGDRGTIRDHEHRSRKSRSIHEGRSEFEKHHQSRSRSMSRDGSERRRRRHHREGESRRSNYERGSGNESERERPHRKHRRRRSRSRSHSRDRGQSEPSTSSHCHLKRGQRRELSSDPLEDFVGPLPAKDSGQPAPVRVRGRGAHKLSSTSNIDAHFSSTYDHSLDVHPDDEIPGEREDWDMALEALRDRQAWKKKHADRMREAGFGDDEIEKWEEAGREKDARDVRWRAKGQIREWDVGKDQQSSGEEDREGRLTP